MTLCVANVNANTTFRWGFYGACFFPANPYDCYCGCCFSRSPFSFPQTLYYLLLCSTVAIAKTTITKIFMVQMFIYTCRPLSCAQYYARDAAAVVVVVLCSPFVRSLKTLSESHVYDFCMCVSCVCHGDVVAVVVVFLRFFFCYYFTSLNFTFAAAVVALYIIRDDDANEQLFFALYTHCLFFIFALSCACVRTYSCAHGCAMCHFFVGAEGFRLIFFGLL